MGRMTVLMAFRAEPGEQARLRALARARGVGVSELLREGLALVLEQDPTKAA